MTVDASRWDPEVYFQEAREKIRAGDLKGAKRCFEKAFQYGKNPEFSEGLIDLSRNFWDRQLWKEAEESLLGVLRVDPDHGEAHRLLRSLHEEPERFHGIKPYFDVQRIEKKKKETPISDVPTIQLFIELTNRCNGKCITCLNQNMKRRRGVMDFDLFRKIVDESLDRLYLEMVHLYGVGEVYLVPEVMKYFDYALERYGSRGIRTCLITNGERITDLPFGLSVADISFNAGRKKTFERVTGMSFDRTVRNIWRLQREGQIDDRINIHMLVFEDNKDEVEDFKRLFAFTTANLVLAHKFDNQCGEIEDRTLPEYRLDEKETEGRIPCHYVREVLNIAWNGDVILCPHDFEGSVNYGNAGKQSLSEIWYGGKHRKMLADHAACRFEGLCGRCNFNLPIEGKDEVISKAERIALRKKYADFARKEVIRCPHGPGCGIFDRYIDRIDEIEGSGDGLVAVCSTDYRFYGVDTVMDPARYPHCPGLKKLRAAIGRTRVTWAAPTFGPSGYAFAARGYMVGLADVGARIRVQPVWGDCKTEIGSRGGSDG